MTSIDNLDLDSFLQASRLPRNIWEGSGMEWEALQAIGRDLAGRAETLRQSARHLASLFQQQCDAVHAVRWRVKDPEHLMAKITRKRAAHVDKYADIDAANYTAKVTDLIGLRVLHLMKEDWKNVDKFLVGKCPLQEKPPIAYVSKGDRDEIRAAYDKAGFDVKEHSAGYRSLHYVLAPLRPFVELPAEVQVRTLFEEGWSEVDHDARYHLPDDLLVAGYLATFNRVAGLADEMASYARGLPVELQRLRVEAENAVAANLERINELVTPLAQKDPQKITQLRTEIARLGLAAISGSTGASVAGPEVYADARDFAEGRFPRHLSEHRRDSFLMTGAMTAALAAADHDGVFSMEGFDAARQATTYSKERLSSAIADILAGTPPGTLDAVKATMTLPKEAFDAATRGAALPKGVVDAARLASSLPKGALDAVAVAGRLPKGVVGAVGPGCQQITPSDCPDPDADGTADQGAGAESDSDPKKDSK
jgi:ppGpp synthetase/RelA/SpoT-type nucleotidyltranferase